MCMNEHDCEQMKLYLWKAEILISLHFPVLQDIILVLIFPIILKGQILVGHGGTRL